VVAKFEAVIVKPSISTADIERRSVDWLWQQRIPRGTISLVAGMPSVGKSLFGHFLAGTTANRGENALYSTVEEAYLTMVRPRVEAVTSSPQALARVRQLRPELPHDADALYREIVQWKAALVVLDPVAGHIGGSIFNDPKVRSALTPLLQVAEVTGAAIVLISHTIKHISAKAHPMDAIGGGGGGLRAIVRMGFLFGPGDDKGELRLSLVKPGLQRSDLPSFVFELDVHQFDDGAEAPFLIEVGEDEGSSLDDARLMLKEQGLSQESKDAKRARAAEFLIDFLRAGPVKPSDVYAAAEKNGHAQRTIRRAADDLKIDRPAGGPNSVWSLPQELLDSLADDDTIDDGDDG
jgi:AAA domain-containing protein